MTDDEPGPVERAAGWIIALVLSAGLWALLVALIVWLA